MKRISVLLLSVVLSCTVAFAKSERRTVVFDVDLHCEGCVSKVEKNIAYEKGVKDLRCDLKKKQVLVVFDPAKTNEEALMEGFAKIKKPATVNAEATEKANQTKK